MITLEYIAGLVDGEGSIGLLHRSRDCGNYISPYFRITICHKQVLEDIQSIIGGNLYTESRVSKGGLTCYALVIGDRQELLAVLDALLPLLRVKKPVAEIVYEFCLNRREHFPFTEQEWCLYYRQLLLQSKHNHRTTQIVKNLLSETPTLS
jgi:hypothetical protein